MRIEQKMLNKERNVMLTSYILDVGGEFQYIQKRPAVMILPGGGYRYCSTRERDPVALAFVQAGYHAFILDYSLKDDAKWPNPLTDYEEAMKYIISKSDEWNVYPDKIAVVGFSAGGHLAAAAATMSSIRPGAAVLGYPVIYGKIREGCLESAPDILGEVDDDTCPFFIFATRTDKVVPVQNSIKFANELADKGIGFEMHIYAYGEHGASVCDSNVIKKGRKMCPRIAQWVPDCIAWLKDVLGDFDDGCLGEPNC